VRRDARAVFEGSGKCLSLRVVMAGVSAWSLARKVGSFCSVRLKKSREGDWKDEGRNSRIVRLRLTSPAQRSIIT
jgi:hypothetical protein